MKVQLFFAMMLSAATFVCNRVPSEPPQDFAFAFKYTFEDVYSLNTFNNTFQRITRSTGDTTISLHLTKPQLDSVYALMMDIDFFSLPEYLEPELDIKAFASPWCSFNVRTAGVMKHVSVGGSFTSGVLAIQNLRRLNDLLVDMIRDSPEYQKLPGSIDAMP